MAQENHFLCATAFREAIRKYHDVEIDSYQIRTLLARAPLNPITLEVYTRGLVRLLHLTKTEHELFYVETDGFLLGAYLEFATALGARLQLQEQQEMEQDELSFVEQAFDAINTYEEPMLQGLDFIRVYLRAALQCNAKKAHALFDTPMYSTESILISSRYIGLCLAEVYKVLNDYFNAHPAYLSMVRQGMGPKLGDIASLALPEIV
jgi:hypothetical protein